MKQDRTTLVLSTRNAHKVQEIRALLLDAFDYLALDDFPGAPRVKEDAATFAGNAAKKAIELAHWLAAGSEAAQHLVPRLTEGTILVLADDSGLEVDALDGAPGVHSARFAAMDRSAANNSTDAANNDKLLRLLKDVPWEQRTARFRCVIAVAVIPSLVHAALKLAVAPEGSATVSILSPRGTSGERNEGRGTQSERASFPQPSPPSDGGEGVSERSDAATAATPLDEFYVELFDGACEGRIGFAAKGSAGFGYDPLFFPINSEQTFAELSEEAKNRISHRGKALAKLRESLPALVARCGAR